MSAQPRFFPPAQPPPGFGAFVPQPAVQAPLGVVLDRPSTLYVGKIPDSLDDKTLRQVLEACGQIMSWKRPTDPMSGRPKAFGLCEFRSGAHALRAMRVIGPLVLRDGTTLLVRAPCGVPSGCSERGLRCGLHDQTIAARAPVSRAAATRCCWCTLCCCCSASR